MAEVRKLNLTGESGGSVSVPGVRAGAKVDAKYKDIIIGIDLGTTNSAVAIYNAGIVPELCPLGTDGKYTMPSCVRWDGKNPETGKDIFTVGDQAYQERYKSNVIYSVKRIMGSGRTVTLEQETGEELTLSPAEVSALILGELKRRAQESYAGVKKCIITVPAYFDQRQMQDTQEAAVLAGLDCVQLLKEPTSASYIYSLMGYAKDSSVLVYDLGGGTFDVTHMRFLRKSSVPKTLITSLKRQYGINAFADGDDESLYYCRVLGTYGDTHLGGDDIDTEMARLVVEESGFKDKITEEDFKKLELECEKFKKANFDGRELTLSCGRVDLTRALLNQAIKMVFDKTMDILDLLPKKELDEVSTIVLVGGSTKSDYLVSLLSNTFPGKEISRVLNPDATVALGAGAVAKDLQQGKGLMYRDVLPMPIGILVDEESVETCIEKNTPMPYSVSRVYYTLHDNQQAISIDVYQGLSSRPEQCTYLGKLRIAGLPPAPAGNLSVKVMFILNAQGRLRIVSSVEGVAREEELIIDSIFNVKEKSEGATSAWRANGDEFEEAIADLLVNADDEVRALVNARRQALQTDDTELIADLENQILNRL